jgi:hypothetical protein
MELRGDYCSLGADPAVMAGGDMGLIYYLIGIPPAMLKIIIVVS